jgi:hypothetical protein
VGAGQNRQPHDVRVLLQRGAGNHLRGLTQAGVNHFHAGIAQRAGDDLGAAIVPVESRLGDDNSQFAHSVILVGAWVGASCYALL